MRMKFLVCSRNMTEVVDLIEDILSDEYEEGEILDEDILYENVSSLEEFSDPEDRKLEVKASKSDVKKLKNRRKKEHKCKEDSLCRKERSGKHCYARIRIRRSSLDCKLKNSGRGASSDVEKKSRPAARPVSPTRGSAKRDSFNKEATKGSGKQDDRSRYPPYYFQHDNRNRANPPRRNVPVRRPTKTRRFSADDRRDHDRKRKSRSPSPRVSVKHHHETSRVVAKTSLLDRLVWSGSIPQKTGGSCEADDCSGKAELDAGQPSLSLHLDHDKSGVPEILEHVDIVTEAVSEGGNSDEKNDACYMNNLCPEDIPVPPTPKATSPLPEPPKEEINELHLRLVALKTAIMKKQNDFKRKKRLAASKKSYAPGNDSFMEFALMGVGDEEFESIPTPPPPGTDCWPPPAVRDLDDPRWSDEDMVIDQESNYGDTIIEANIPATDSNMQNCVTFSVSASSPSSQDKLPCCKGNPIPVVSPHRPAKEIDERRPALSSSTSVIIPVQEIAPPPVIKETPKYLKEINSNLKSGMKRRRTARRPRQRRRRNSIRQRTPVVKRIEKKSVQHKEPVARKSKIFEGDDDEDALRQLALMSVKPKSTITGGMLAKINENLNPLHIETDPAALVVKPESPAKNTSPEAWEDLDEDILRAQLLSSLTRNIPAAPSQPPLPPVRAAPVKRVVIERNMPLRKDVLIKRLNKENLYTKRNVIVHPHVKSSKRNTKKYINPNTKATLTPLLKHPVVEKFIIRVSETESSEDEEKTVRGKIVSDFEDALGQKMDLESSIDKLLEEARKETELIQKATPCYPMYDCPEELPELKEEMTSPLYDVTDVKSELPSPVENTLIPTNTVQDGSPVADRKNEDEDSRESREGTSHLPAWQQEEFERQKRVMAQKESIIAAAKEKIKAKNNLVAASLLTKLPRDVEKHETDETSTTSAVTAPIIPVVKESSGGVSAVKVADNQSSENRMQLSETVEATVILSGDQDCCVEKEVNSCVETMISKVCTEMDTGYTGNLAVPESAPELDVACDSSNSEAGPGNEAEIANGIKIEVAKASSLPVTAKTWQDEALLPDPVTTKVSGNATLLPRLLLQQQKKRLQNRTSQNHNPVVSQDTRIGTNPITAAPEKSPVRGPRPTIQKKTQLPVLTTASQVKSSLPNGVAHSAVSKPLSAVRDSSYALKGLNEMNDLVSGLEKGMSEYRNLRKDFIAQRKQLMLIQQKMSKKRQLLLEMKDKIENRKRLIQSTISMDTSSLSPLPDNKDQQKQSSRASELLTLKFKEVCLKAQFAMMGLETASRPPASVKMSRPAEDSNQSPRKKMKLKTRPAARPPPKALPSKMPTPGQSESADPGTSHKLVVSVRDSDKMDPLIPLCPYDMKGVCMDEECQYQHLKN